MASQFLDGILARQNRATNLKVVFVDVSSYSKRRSQSQAAVIDSFMQCLEEARKATAKQFIEYAEANKINFTDDLVFLPSGDGAAVCFPFEGLHDVHLHFAKQLLNSVHQHNGGQECDRFGEQGWCNCHSAFNLTVGISEGKGVLYRDVNGNYNVAGNVINMAARVMGLADKNQILFTEDAYRQIIDLVDDAHLDEKFSEFKNAKIKHDLRITVYQYTEDGLAYLNGDPPFALAMAMKENEAKDAMSKLGMPMPSDDVQLDSAQKLAVMDLMTNGLSQILNPQKTIDASAIQSKPEDET